MVYSKILLNNSLQRIEKGKAAPANATQISRNEYYCLGAALKIFVAAVPSENITPRDWGYKND